MVAEYHDNNIGFVSNIEQIASFERRMLPE
jgi:hypothetical protein